MGSIVAVPLLGGALVGMAASGLLLFNGRITGVSGIVAGALRDRGAEAAWRWAFVAGLIAGGAVLRVLHPAAFAGDSPRSLPVVAIAGVLVGVGARVANGCTSGHGVCGLARRSRRGAVATLTFIASGAATVYLVDHALRTGSG